MKSAQKVYVGLSGGVDSSVTAALLQQQGYDVTGVYIKNWTQDLIGFTCPWKDDLRDARAVAAKLDIPFKIYDFQTEYRRQVVDYMIAEYKKGLTPNPDIMCNQEIKFKLFLQAALDDGADLIATGHYAKIQDGQLLRGIDDNKDQTYFLYRVTKAALEKSLMPIGEFTKPEVRRLARKFGLPTADKKDSVGICFIGPIGMKDFLKQYVQTEPGQILTRDGQVLGQHDGAIFFTIGQRRGLGVGGGKPYYVIGKDMTKNQVFVTDNPNDLELNRDKVGLKHIHWIDPQQKISGTKTYQARLRHLGRLIDCRVKAIGKGLTVKLDSPQRGVAAGQSLVLYDGRTILGGGIITAD